MDFNISGQTVQRFIDLGYMRRKPNLKIRRIQCLLCKGNPTIAKDFRNVAGHINRQHGKEL